MESAGGYWLLKSEPGEWGWDHQAGNGGISHWDGVRNAQAQKNLRSMQHGDYAFFYHSGGKSPAVVGVVEVVRTAYPDASDESGKSCMVDVRALTALPNPVALSVLKSEECMRDWILLRQSRLSVLPVSPSVWSRVCELGDLSPPPTLPSITITDQVQEIVTAEHTQLQVKKKKEERKRNPGVAQNQTEEMERTKTNKRTEGRTNAESEKVPRKTVSQLPKAATRSVVDAKQVDQATESEFVSEVKVKTYQRKSRKRTTTVEVAENAKIEVKKKKNSRSVS